MDLPVTLPEIDDFTPTGTGEPPLAKADAWVSSYYTIQREVRTLLLMWASFCHVKLLRSTLMME